jgi:Omptin family
MVTAALAIAGMLGFSAIANAGNDSGPQWPNLYQPQWPNLPGERGYDPAKATPAPASVPAAAPEPELTTGSVRKPVSPVAARWGEFKQPPAFFGEFGLRYVYSSTRTAKNLYDIQGDAMLSRLTYGGISGNSGEGFGRIEHTSGFFLKGYVGAGALSGGKLQDEDFPPVTSPYSSTKSQHGEGYLAYGSVDLGFNVIRQPGLRIGAFAGYHYLSSTVNAYGCVQTASNSGICGDPIPDSVKVISQSNHWNSLRIGLDAKIALGDRFSLNLDAAWLPYVKLGGSDAHWLRIGTTPGAFTGSIPEDGQGTGYQLEAAIAYAVNPNVSFAVGGRYWRMDSSGITHFDGHVVGVNALPQPVEWKVENIGVFVQGSFKFGPYPTGGVF